MTAQPKKLQSKKVCLACGGHFLTNRANQIYCSSRVCRKERHRVYQNKVDDRKRGGPANAPRQCHYCGNSFRPSSPTQRYCNKSCGSSHKLQQRQAYAEQRRNAKMIPLDAPYVFVAHPAGGHFAAGTRIRHDQIPELSIVRRGRILYQRLGDTFDMLDDIGRELPEGQKA